VRSLRSLLVFGALPAVVDNHRKLATPKQATNKKETPPATKDQRPKKKPTIKPKSLNFVTSA